MFRLFPLTIFCRNEEIPMTDTRDDQRIIHDVAYEVRKRVHGPAELGWIAKQSVTEMQPLDDLYCFVIGKGVACVRMQDALNATEALYNDLATQIMGYAPGSEEDLKRRREEAGIKMVQSQEESERAQLAFAHWRNLYGSL